jgi:hypothetical protein
MISRRSFLEVAAFAECGTLAGCLSARGKAPSVWHRLPVGTLPENVFVCFGNEDFEGGPETTDKLLDLYAEHSTFNLITLSLRCRKDLSDPEVFRRVGDFAAKAKTLGIQVHMDIDPRIARAEFLKRWPEDAQREIVVATEKPVNGIAVFKVIADSLNDHMTGGTRGYEATEGRLVAAYAVKFSADGTALSSRVVRGTVKGSGLPLAVTVGGLAADETAVVLAEFELFSCDVFSPHLIPFVRELMERYAKLPVSGAMHDEWGFPPGYGRQMQALRAFWYSPHYAAAYATATGGRDLSADCLLFAFPFKGREAERSLAVRSFMWLNFERQKEIEEAFYKNDKALFGKDAYVTKHSTWWSDLVPMEFSHDGLSWWAAKRDWAQSDERAPLPACTGMAKKFGGPCWLNEWYSVVPATYGRNVWRYALSGGRVVYHPLYGSGNPLDALPYPVRRIRQYADLLTPPAVRAQSRVRLLNLVSRGQLDCPVAVVFDHRHVMDWSGSSWGDCGKDLMYALWRKGYAVDAYPSDEFGEGTFAVDRDGFLRVGQQRYTALVLYRLADDAAEYTKFIAGREPRTKVFRLSSRYTPVDAEPILAALDAARAVKQTPLTEDDGTYPAPDGTAFLTDGTAFRVSALKDVAGDPIAGTLLGAAFKAEGLFAVRNGNDGKPVAIAAGGLASLEAPGLSLRFDAPQDIAFWKEHGHWRGVWQTFSETAPVPAALLSVTSEWTRLLLPAPIA